MLHEISRREMRVVWESHAMGVIPPIYGLRYLGQPDRFAGSRIVSFPILTNERLVAGAPRY